MDLHTTNDHKVLHHKDILQLEEYPLMAEAEPWSILTTEK